MKCSKFNKTINISGPNGSIATILEVPTDIVRCPLVILMHGFTSNKENIVMTTMAKSLLRKNIASIRFDFNGHGESDGSSKDMTIPNEILDANTIFEYANTLSFVNGIAFLGHSQGGVVASMLAGQLGSNRVKSLVLMSPGGVIPDSLANGNIFGTHFDKNNLPETVVVHNGFIVGREYIVTGMKLPIYKVSANYKGAVCIMYGKEDLAVPYNYVEEYASIYPGSELFVMNGLDHNFEPGLEDVAQLVSNFVVKHFSNNMSSNNF
jgi:pimeloyl-ACP methyl ester carboxylesterase